MTRARYALLAASEGAVRGAVVCGEVNISLDNIERIAHALGLTADQLLVEAEQDEGRP